MRVPPARILGAAALAALLAALLGAGGCASGGGGELGAKAMEMAGLKVPENLDDLRELRAAIPRKQTADVALRIHAADQLNTTASRQSLSVVVRIYKLKRLDAFLAAPYAAFGEAAGESKAFGDELVEVREIVMRPGQKYEVVESVPKEAAFVAVAALFRAPAPGRWRFAFDTGAAARGGITLGLHGCAISVAGVAAERSAPELMRVAGVRCE